ncbi:hypothetical protein D7030_05260 [Flavobacteriaceae bacterium AU392]|nr:hypothetical protein D1817_11735 [Flavobacteriaceae bacterium]RKM86085.1 hypothetical protein D7030_05260 [Flavobacteriaceae bacterium AU392]
MKNFKPIIFFIVCILLFTCEDVENNRRLGFDINVVDINNVAIPNVNVVVFANGREIGVFDVLFVLPLFLPNFNGVLGFGNTDTDGELRLISLAPDRNNGSLAIIINGVTDDNTFVNSVNENFGAVIFEIDDDPESNTIDLPDVILRRVALLNFDINNTSGSQNILRFSLETDRRNQIFNLIDGSDNVSNIIQKNLFPEDLSLSMVNETLQNTIATFSYTLSDDSDNLIDSGVIQIPINQDVVNYVFEY